MSWDDVRVPGLPGLLPRVSSDAVAAFSMPRLVDLGQSLVGAVFDVMKLLPAAHIIDRALEQGEISSGTVVLETTSGTFGLGLAMVCALRGLPLHLVSDPTIEGYFHGRLLDLGAQVTVVREPAAMGGYQAARLRRLGEIAERCGSYFVPSQYDSPGNPAAYTALARHLQASVGSIDWVVGPVGSGGSMCGTLRALRTGEDVQAAGVDTHGSCLFGQEDAPRLLRGLGNSLLPKNLDHSVFDEVHWVDASTAYAATRHLHKRHALYMGPTSGAAYLVARHITKRACQRTVVLLPDSGHRYEATAHSDTWLRANAHPVDIGAALSHGPDLLRTPPRLGHDWQYMKWRRRSLEEVRDDGAQHFKEEEYGE